MVKLRVKYTHSLFLLLFVSTISLWSAPVKDMPVKLKQPDGKVIKCFVSGDEYHNWIHSEDNYTIVKHPQTGYYVFAIEQDGKLLASDYIVGRVEPGSVGLVKGVNISHPDLEQKTQKPYLLFSQNSGIPNDIKYTPKTGTINTIVVFVRFADEAEFTDSISTYDRLFNDEDNDAVSVTNYYDKASYGQVNLNFFLYPESGTDLVISYQDVQPRGYYEVYSENNPLGYTENQQVQRRQELVRNAATYVSPFISADINIDANGDNLVDNFILIVKGDAEGWSDILWPHMSTLGMYQVKINDKIVYTYNLQLSEWTKRSVGVVCHEIGHSFGAPDLYHYNDNGIIPVGPWDIMASSNEVPTHMSAYLKYTYFDWIEEIPEITGPGTYSLNPLTSAAGNCVKIKSPYSSREYFVLEYRKSSDQYESNLPGEGLLVYRVFPNNWGNSQANNSSVWDELYLYRLDGTLYNNGYIDLAHMSANAARREINDNTNPSSFLGDSSPGGLNIYNISETSDSITFDVSFEPTVQSYRRIISPKDYASNYHDKDFLTPQKNENIKWQGFNDDLLTIQFSSDMGNTWSVVAEHVDSDLENYIWTVPQVESPDCIIKIFSESKNYLSVQSDLFTISSTFSGTYIEYTAENTDGIQFIDADTGFITSGHYIYKTTDGGSTYETIYKASADLTSLFFIDSNHGWATGVRGLILTTTDGGKTWNTQYLPDAIQVNSIVFKDTQNGLAVGANFGSIAPSGIYVYRTENGGNAWERIKVAYQSFSGWDIDLLNDNEVIISSTSPYIFASHDFGRTWETIATSNIQLGETDFYNTAIGWGVGFDDICKTTDGGQTWQSQFNSDEESISASFYNLLVIDKNQVFVFGSHGTILKTDDGGSSWEQIDLGINNDIRTSIYAYGNVYAGGSSGLILKSKLIESNAVSLNAGWNLISYNKGHSEYPVNEFFSEIYDDVEAVISFDQKALLHIPGQNFYNDFDTLDALHGYWVKMKNSNIYTKEDEYIDPYTPISLSKGWNLVSYLPSVSDNIQNALESIQDNLIVAMGFDEEGLTYNPSLSPDLNTLNILEPDKGYWIKLADSDTLYYPFINNSSPFSLNYNTVQAKTSRIVNPTTQWINIYCDDFTVNGQLIKAGSIIRAIDPEGIVCGEYKIKTDGKLGLMPVYSDSPLTTVFDEGADPGDRITIQINGEPCPGAFIWTEFGESVNLKDVITDFTDTKQQPSDFKVAQNFPNPFNPATTIMYQLPENGRVRISVFNIQAEEVATLIDKEQNAGYYNIEWNAGIYASGVYFYRVQFENNSITRKMLLLK